MRTYPDDDSNKKKLKNIHKHNNMYSITILHTCSIEYTRWKKTSSLQSLTLYLVHHVGKVGVGRLWNTGLHIMSASTTYLIIQYYIVCVRACVLACVYTCMHALETNVDMLHIMVGFYMHS